MVLDARLARRLAAAALLALTAWPAHSMLRTEAELQPARPAASAAVRRATLRPEAQVRLDAPSAQELARSRDGQRVASGRIQVGFARPVAELRTASDVARRFAWARLEGERQVAALAITSPGASALRVALRMGAVPRGTRFRFSDAAGVAEEVDAAQVEAAIARNVYYGDDGPSAHLYWSPVIEGETVVVEIEVPAGASPPDARVAIPLVSHLVSSAAEGFALACAEAACATELGPADPGALVRIVFTEDGATYACQGMLVADRDPATVIPYFLTASHCVARQSAASTLQPFWPRGGRACGVDVQLQPGAPGATLLRADASTDLALLRLLEAPPAGATYAGWVVGATTALAASSAGGQGGAAASSGGVQGGAAASSGVVQGVAAASNAVVPVAYGGEGKPAASSSSASTGSCPAAGERSTRFEHAYNAGLYQWLGGTPQDAADNASSASRPGS